MAEPNGLQEADVEKKRVWIGNGVATFIICVMAMNLFAMYILVLALAPGLVQSLTPEQRGSILGVLMTQYVAAISYWIGTSLSSQNKSIELAQKRNGG